MNHAKVGIGLLLALVLVGSAFAQAPAIGFDLENAQGHNYYYFNFYVNQVLGNVFDVVGTSDLTVTHLGVFDMNPDNEPYWDLENPTLAEHGFQTDHGVAIFHHPEMTKLAEVIIPAGAGTPIQDEGFRYLPLTDPLVLQAGESYVLAHYWGAASIVNPGMDTFYLLGTGPNEIPSEVYIHDAIAITDGCFNPNAGDGSTVDAPFIFNMFWGMYAGGANFLIEETVAVESKTLSDVKTLFR